MKKIVFVFLIFLAPVAVFSHPGKTDLYGGHKCWKGCEEWDLLTGEYHLHGKDFMPIKTDRNRRSAVEEPDEGVSNTQVSNTPPPPDIPRATAQTSVPDAPKEKPVKNNAAIEKNVAEENIFPGGYIFLFLAGILLLLLLLILRTTKRHKR